MAERRAVGRDGESIAAGYLERLGYAIRARNYRCPLGEIDLIATDGDYVVFVEVKTRSRRTPYHPTLAMTAAKRERLRRLGAHYLAHDAPPGRPLQPRFDVVAVVMDGTAGPDDPAGGVEHYVNAF